jgi:hypothetical protein
MPTERLAIQQIWNDTEARRRVAEEDAKPENQLYDDGFRDVMMPPPPEDLDENGEYHPGPSFAEQFASSSKLVGNPPSTSKSQYTLLSG